MALNRLELDDVIDLKIIAQLAITCSKLTIETLEKGVKASKLTYHPAGIYLLKVNNRNTRKRCEICSKLTIKIPERRLVFLLLTLSR